MPAWIDVAVLAKTRNSKGRFAARCTAGLPFLLEPGDEVALVPPKIDVPRNVTVQEVVNVDDAGADVKFVEVDGLDVAEQMVGMHCLIPRSLVDESVFQEAPGTWEGWSFVDQELGELGRVSGLIENPAQMLLQVERDDGLGTLLVPVVDEIILNVDVEAGVVHACIPKGLLDL